MPLEPFIGQLMAFAGNFAPRGYAQCQGQILPISQNTALFSILGTTYGGDGRTNFALPDLRGRTPIHMGTAATGTPYVEGEQGGAESVTLLAAEMPAHNHALVASAVSATTASPAGATLAEAHGGGRGTTFDVDLYAAAGAATTLSPQQVATALGPATPHNNLQPYLTITWCIALQGIFPTRN
ncbi:MAG TPA: tail fiber protein [Stellaceae bacterium]|nr:tail fiber protein [Stellaceae bacterium]